MPNYNISDEQLAKLAQADDEDAAAELFGRYKELIRKKANLYFMMGADKDDINQEGMIGLFKAIRGYNADKGASFKTFADMCVNNQILSAVQRASRMKHEPLNNSFSIHETMKGDHTIEEVIKDEQEITPEIAILLDEQLDYLIEHGDEIFSKLELEVWESFLVGKDYIEISKALGKSPKAIDNALQRMKKKIQQLFKG